MGTAWSSCLDKVETKRVELRQAVPIPLPELPGGLDPTQWDLDTDLEALLGTAVAMGLVGGIYEIVKRLNPEMAKELNARKHSIANSVGYIKVTSAGGGRTGTCVLLTPNLLVTCCHVVKDVQEARDAQVTFYVAETADGPYVATTGRLQPDVLFLSSADEDSRRKWAEEELLDFVLIAFTPDVPFIAPTGVEARISPKTWQKAKKKVKEVQIAGVHAERQVLEMFPPGKMKDMGTRKQGPWSYPLQYLASTEGSYSGGAVLTIGLDVLGIHQGGVEQSHNFGCPMQVVFHSATAVWEHQQRERTQRADRVGGIAQEDFVRLVRAQGITVSDPLPAAVPARVVVMEAEEKGQGGVGSPPPVLPLIDIRPPPPPPAGGDEASGGDSPVPPPGPSAVPPPLPVRVRSLGRQEVGAMEMAVVAGSLSDSTPASLAIGDSAVANIPSVAAPVAPSKESPPPPAHPALPELAGGCIDDLIGAGVIGRGPPPLPPLPASLPVSPVEPPALPAPPMTDSSPLLRLGSTPPSPGRPDSPSGAPSTPPPLPARPSSVQPVVWIY